MQHTRASRSHAVRIKAVRRSSSNEFLLGRSNRPYIMYFKSKISCGRQPRDVRPLTLILLVPVALTQESETMRGRIVIVLERVVILRQARQVELAKFKLRQPLRIRYRGLDQIIGLGSLLMQVSILHRVRHD